MMTAQNFPCTTFSIHLVCRILIGIDFHGYVCSSSHSLNKMSLRKIAIDAPSVSYHVMEKNAIEFVSPPTFSFNGNFHDYYYWMRLILYIYFEQIIIHRRLSLIYSHEMQSIQCEIDQQCTRDMNGNETGGQHYVCTRNKYRT